MKKSSALEEPKKILKTNSNYSENV